MSNQLKAILLAILLIPLASFFHTALAQNPTGYTQIDVIHRSPVDSKMQFSGSAKLKAEISVDGQKYSATLEVESNTKTRAEAAKELADLLKNQLPAKHKDKVKQREATITVTGTDKGPGTGDKPHEHPNTGTTVNTNRARTTQFSG